MKIDLLVGNNLYDSTTTFAKSLSAAFKEIGVESRLFWIDEGFFYQAFYEISSDPPDFTCSFSDIRLGNIALADLWQIPHLFVCVDPSIYFLHHVKSPFSVISLVDEEDVQFIRSLGCEKAFFLPHGTDERHLTSPEVNRSFEKVFFGSCIDVEMVFKRWNEDYSKEQVDLLQAASKEVLSPKGLSPLKALATLGVKEIDLPLFHYEVDLYTRGADRIELLKNHNVHIWGEGPWEKFCPKASVHKKVPFDECIEIMKQSKFVFNSSPRFKQGSHERIFYALMCGAVPITGNNGFVKTHFSKEELLTYEFGKWEFSSIVSDWKEMALRGQERVLSSHTWSHRARKICDMLNKRN